MFCQLHYILYISSLEYICKTRKPASSVLLQVCISLSQVAKHNLDLAESITEASVFPKVLTCLRHPDAMVCAAAAGLVCEVVKHSAELAQLVVGAGGVNALAQCMQVWTRVCLHYALSRVASDSFSTVSVQQL